MIKLRNEELEAFKSYNAEHNILLSNLKSDIRISNYIHPDLDKFVKEPSVEDTMEIGSTYIIKHDNRCVGICGIQQFENKKIIDLWYALADYYRTKGYGSKILGLLTQYLLENITDIDDIQLSIDKSNEASKVIALKNGYSLSSQTSDKYRYRYFN